MAALVRPEPLPGAAARPARVRPQHPARRTHHRRAARQHHPAPPGRPRAPARAARRRPLARPGRVLGLHARPGVRAGAPRAGPRPRAVLGRHHHPPRGRVGHARHAPAVPARVGDVRGRAPRGRARRRPGRGLPPAARRPRPRGAPRRRPGLVRLGGPARLAHAGARPALRRPRVRPRVRAAGHALLEPRRLARRHRAARRHDPPARDPRPARHRPGRRQRPPDVAHDLAARWPDAELVIVPDAGHGTGAALEAVVREAVSRFAAEP